MDWLTQYLIANDEFEFKTSSEKYIYKFSLRILRSLSSGYLRPLIYFFQKIYENNFFTARFIFAGKLFWNFCDRVLSKSALYCHLVNLWSSASQDLPKL